MKIFAWSSIFLSSVAFASIAGIENTEKDLGINDTTMYTMIYITDMDKALQKNCSADSLSLGKIRQKKVEHILQKKYDGKKKAWILDKSWALYSILEKYHAAKKTGLSEDNYCSLQYVLYHTQQYLRNAHLKILKDTEIIKDFEGFNVQKIYGWATKRDLLDMKLKELAVYEKKLGTLLSFKEKNSNFKKGLSATEKELFDRSKSMMERSLYKALYKLKSAGIFTQKDIDILKDKTILEYVDNCQTVNGRYEIKETLKSGGQHVKYETEALRLKVNMCGNFFVLRDLDTTYEKIITHELGHHFYYYHDRLNNADFEKICWISGQKQNKKCTNADFVTDYAQSAAVEDYAEHFMHWFLKIIPRNTKILEKKSKHFIDAI